MKYNPVQWRLSTGFDSEPHDREYKQLSFEDIFPDAFNEMTTACFEHIAEK